MWLYLVIQKQGLFCERETLSREEGDIEAQLELAEFYSIGSEGVELDFNQYI